MSNEIIVAGRMDNTMDNTFESANRVYDVSGIAPTINCCGGGGLQTMILEEPQIVAMRGRNPENPKSRKSGLPTEQMIEPNMEGLCNTITTVQKDNLVMTESERTYRIRKLTPKECWRLMGYTDEDYDKAAKVNSNTQLYKQAGNAIVKDVMMAIFRKLGADKNN